MSLPETMDRRDEKGQFAPKFGQTKKLYSFRLSEDAIKYLDFFASAHNLSRTDLIEAWARGENLNDEILFRIKQFIESQRDHAGGNQHKPKGELRTTGRDWRKLNEFRRWIEDE